jgi:hypothetical protein
VTKQKILFDNSARKNKMKSIAVGIVLAVTVAVALGCEPLPGGQECPDTGLQHYKTP